MISCLKITYFVVTTEEISVEELVYVKIEEDGLDLFYFILDLFFYFSIFRTTRVRIDWSCHHISHLMM